jgi:hypothetical protein
MAYFSLHAYDADVYIPAFLGLRQSDEIASDLRFAMEAENVETPRGVLQPMAAPEILDYTFENKIETIARFHRRWYTGTGSKDWMIAASGGKLFYMQSGGTTWTELPKPESLTVRYEPAVPPGYMYVVAVDQETYRAKVSGTAGTTIRCGSTSVRRVCGSPTSGPWDRIRIRWSHRQTPAGSPHRIG